jgi:hypothetical protein
MQLASLFALSMLVAPLAHADVRPPPLRPPADRTPAEARQWLVASAEAMKDKDMEHGARLCDPRGWAENLVGPSGTRLESLFSQGARKGWHLVGRFEDTRWLPAGRGVILKAVVEDDDSGRELDALHLLLVRVTDAGGAVRWLALGAGEKVEQVRALADRYLADQPLAPPSDAPRTPE